MDNHKISHRDRIGRVKTNYEEGTLICLSEARETTEGIEHIGFIQMRILWTEEKETKRV